MAGRERCCDALARAHGDPEELFREQAGIDLSALGRSRDGQPLTTTARGLVLRRDGLVQHGEERVLGRDGWRLVPWHHDTYAGGLGLLEGALGAVRGERVLDVAAGLAVFPTEASILGAEVDAVDAGIDAEHPSFAAAGSWFVDHYAEQIELVRCLARHARLSRYAMDEPTARLVERLYAERDRVARFYPAVSGRRFADDARSLDAVDDGVYDLVLCGWLMAHLDEGAEREVVSSLVRVARPGGRVHLKAGWGGDAAARYASWFGPSWRVTGRSVSIDSRDGDDCVVLRVG